MNTISENMLFTAFVCGFHDHADIINEIKYPGKYKNEDLQRSYDLGRQYYSEGMELESTNKSQIKELVYEDV